MALQKRIMLPLLVLLVIVVVFVFMVTRQQALAPENTEDGAEDDSMEQIEQDLQELDEEFESMESDFEELDQEADSLEEEV